MTEIGDRLLFLALGPSRAGALHLAAAMPRIPRSGIDCQVTHVLSRGNARGTVFHSPADYAAFLKLLEKGKTQFGISVFAFCLMPNHFHAVLHPERASDLSALMQWWLTSHVRRHHRIHDSTGHVWQGRFKSFPIQQDEHLLTVLRYVLLNPVRALLAPTAFSWPWTSLRFPELVDPWPINPPLEMASWLSDSIPGPEVDRVRKCITRRTPYGEPAWQEDVALKSGLAVTLRPRGRPPESPSGKCSLSPILPPGQTERSRIGEK